MIWVRLKSWDCVDMWYFGDSDVMMWRLRTIPLLVDWTEICPLSVRLCHTDYFRGFECANVAPLIV